MMIAWGRTGWFDDFSRAAAAQSISWSMTFSITLRPNSQVCVVNTSIKTVSYRGFIVTNTMVSDNVYSSRGYRFRTMYSRLWVFSLVAHSKSRSDAF